LGGVVTANPNRTPVAPRQKIGKSKMDNHPIYFNHPIPLNHMPSIWISKYRDNRYLANISNNDLKNRISDIAQNIFIFDEEVGKYKLQYNMGADGLYRPVRNLDWLCMLAETYEEFRLRSIEIPRLPSQASTIACERELSKKRWAKRDDLAEASKPSLDTYENPKLLFRYSKRQFNEEMLSSGKVRIAPASSYNDSTLKRAQRDDEKILEVAEAGKNTKQKTF
jgi:hypothetical protein